MDAATLLQSSPNLVTNKAMETQLLPQGTPRSTSQTQAEKSFEAAIQQALSEANQVHLDADASIRRLASGEEVDLHGTMIAIEKAGIATRLTLQVRNKALEAYQEIMRMQV